MINNLYIVMEKRIYVSMYVYLHKFQIHEYK